MGSGTAAVHGTAAGQNMVLSFADVSGTFWDTSQCSTIFPFRTRKRSTIA